MLWNFLCLKFEYDGNNYQNDFVGKLFQVSYFNVGVVYCVVSWVDFNLSYVCGNMLMFGFMLWINFNDLCFVLCDMLKLVY